MNRIVIATDGSASADEAVRIGLELAAEQDAEVRLVHVAPLTEWAAPAMYAAVKVPHRLTETDVEPLEEAARLADEHGVRAQTKLLAGDVVDEVVAYADDVDADLIVVGSRGLGAIAGTLLGSTSRGILHESKRPVLVVRGATVPTPTVAV